MIEEKKEVNASEPNVQAQTESTKVEAPAIETEQDKNWKKFREIREQERKAADEAAKRAQEKEAEAAALKAALEAVVNRPQQYQRQEEEGEESEEQRFERKYKELRAREKTEEEQLRQKEERVTYPVKLRQIHKDFDQVCARENLDYLDFHHPELASALENRPDGLEKWLEVYKAVKRYIPNTNASRDQAKAQQNLSKPQSYAGSTTPSGETLPAMHLDESRKQANWARMQAALKGLS